MVCACAHGLKIGPQSRRSAHCAPVALWQILLWHMDGFAINGVAALFAGGIAACIQGCIVPVVGAGNDVIAAGDPLGR